MSAIGTADNSKSSLRFNLRHCAYAVTLFSAAGLSCGSLGLVAALFPAIAGLLRFFDDRRQRLLAFVFLWVVQAGIVFYSLLPTLETPREVAERFHKTNQLRTIMLGLLNYHDTQGRLPPPNVTDAAGRPMHSWRVLILPYVGEDALFAKYRFDEPWDGPNNRLLATVTPNAYRPYRRAADGQTFFTAAVGERTMWPLDRPRGLGDVADPLPRTLWVVEGRKPMPWSAPEDPDLDEFIRQNSGSEWEQPEPNILRGHWADGVGARYWGWSDESVETVHGMPSADEWRRSWQIDDGPGFANGQRWVFGEVVRNHYDRHIALVCFVVLYLLPFVWPRRETRVRNAAVR